MKESDRQKVLRYMEDRQERQRQHMEVEAHTSNTDKKWKAFHENGIEPEHKDWSGKSMRRLVASLPMSLSVDGETQKKWDKGASDDNYARWWFVRGGEPDVLRFRGEIYGCAGQITPCDYYHHQGYPWVHPKLEAWAEKQGGYIEWEDAGSCYFNPA